MMSKKGKAKPSFETEKSEESWLGALAHSRITEVFNGYGIKVFVAHPDKERWARCRRCGGKLKTNVQKEFEGLIICSKCSAKARKTKRGG